MPGTSKVFFPTGPLPLKGSGRILSVAGWQTLPDLTLAIRFAWLSEWLRKSDTEMVSLELTYIYLLMDNHKKLKTLWGID